MSKYNSVSNYYACIIIHKFKKESHYERKTLTKKQICNNKTKKEKINWNIWLENFQIIYNLFISLLKKITIIIKIKRDSELKTKCDLDLDARNI